MEYAAGGSDMQAVLKPLAIALLVHVARRQREVAGWAPAPAPAEAAARRIAAEPGSVTLSGLAAELGYHPNYLSGLLRKETGKTFSCLVLEARMERASVLLHGSGLTVEEVAGLVGYSNPSNFHAAFRDFWGRTPGEHRRIPD